MSDHHPGPTPPPAGSAPPGPTPPDWHDPPAPYVPVPQPEYPGAEPGMGHGGAAGPGHAGLASPGAYVPTGYAPGQQQQPQHPGTQSGGRGSAIGGSIAAAAAFFGKFGFAIFKLGKIGPTAISMVISLLIYTTFYGWRFAAGFVLLILVHETGHMVFARSQGMPTGLPIFLGPFGAVIRTKGSFADKRQEAIVAIGGPFFGTLGAAALLFVGLHGPTGYFRGLLLALAYTGFFLNLFNLLPINPLDGGRVANAVTRWANVIGLVIIGLIVLSFFAAGRTPNALLIIILVIGAVSTYQRFRRAGRNEDTPEVPPATRAWIGLAYLGMLAFAALGMTVAGSEGIHDNGAGNQVSWRATVSTTQGVGATPPRSVSTGDW